MTLTKSQTLTLLQEVVEIRHQLRSFLAGTFTTRWNAVATAIAAGDDTPETAAQRQALDAIWSAAGSLWESTDGLMGEMSASLGRYSGSPRLADAQANIAYFNAKLAADSEAIRSRGLTKFSSWTPGGSNVGTGDFVVFNLDPAGVAMDVSHIETLTLECVQSSFEQATRGRESFAIRGSDKGAPPWAEQGSQRDGGHRWTLGLRPQDYPAGEQGMALAQVGGRLPASGVSRNAANILRNGDFAAALGSGTAKIESWPITAGEANVDVDVATPAFGLQALKLTGDAVLRQSLEAPTRRAYVLQAYGRRPATVTDGEITVKVMDDSTTHATITIDVSTGTGITADTWTKGGATPFVLPDNVGNNLRVEIELDDYDGAGNVLVDGVMLVPLVLLDGRAVAILEGITPWRRGDTATGATTVSETGKIQREFNNAFRRYVRHAGSATFWTDPT